MSTIKSFKTPYSNKRPLLDSENSFAILKYIKEVPIVKKII